MIIFNALAAGMLIPALLAGYAVQAVVGNLLQENGLAVLIAMGIAFLADSSYRSHQVESGPLRIVDPATGGHVMFAPVWFLALLMIGKVVYDHLIV